ncbi:MAG: DUF4214 domain-containing protein [Clostridia bacterium]|nr:DUF4214 domain-containing protein [Clostridia bacterium]
MKSKSNTFKSLVVSLLVICIFGNMTVFAYSDYSVDSGVGAFVARLYNICLERDYDQGGLNGWCEALLSGETDGGTVAKGFFNSDEYKYIVADDDTQYLTKLYRVFFNREPDETGFNGWLAKLGTSENARETVMNGFINSAEWINTCAEYGINSGSNLAPVNNNNADITEGIRIFVNSLYEGCLGREADSEGFNGWALKLANREATGRDVAYGFFFSTEFINKYNSLSTEEKVQTFYQVFFNRAADEGGLKSWCSIINNGGTLETLFNGFSFSVEFKNKCNACGIVYSWDDVDVQPVPETKTEDKPVATATPVPTEEPIVVVPEEKDTNQCSDRFNDNSLVTVTVDCGNGETQEVTGYFDYEAEEEILDLLNETRVAEGLEPLVMTDEFRDAARLRAVEIVVNPSHDRPNGESCFTAIPWHNAGGENIAAGFNTAYDYNYQWYNSEGHRANMLNEKFKYVGIGVFVCEGSVYGEYAAEAFSG